MSTAATIDPKIVKDLRDRTHAGMMDCKKALTEANGNPEEAEKILRKKFNLAAGKRPGGKHGKGSSPPTSTWEERWGCWWR